MMIKTKNIKELERKFWALSRRVGELSGVIDALKDYLGVEEYPTLEEFSTPDMPSVGVVCDDSGNPKIVYKLRKKKKK